MSTVDIEVLGNSMVEAVRESVSERWPSLRSLADLELRRLAQTFAHIEEMLRSGEIDADRASRLVQIHQLTLRSVLCTVEGLGVRTAEQATRAAVTAAGALLNQAVGFKLL